MGLNREKMKRVWWCLMKKYIESTPNMVPFGTAIDYARPKVCLPPSLILPARRWERVNTIQNATPFPSLEVVWLCADGRHHHLHVCVCRNSAVVRHDTKCRDRKFNVRRTMRLGKADFPSFKQLHFIIVCCKRGATGLLRLGTYLLPTCQHKKLQRKKNYFAVLFLNSRRKSAVVYYHHHHHNQQPVERLEMQPRLYLPLLIIVFV